MNTVSNPLRFVYLNEILQFVYLKEIFQYQPILVYHFETTNYYLYLCMILTKTHINY